MKNCPYVLRHLHLRYLRVECNLYLDAAYNYLRFFKQTLIIRNFQSVAHILNIIELILNRTGCKFVPQH